MTSLRVKADAGLKDAVIQDGVVTAGAIESVMTGNTLKELIFFSDFFLNFARRIRDFSRKLIFANEKIQLFWGAL